MAIRQKIGLDYFRFDVDFFSDEKIEFTSARFGIKGELIAVKLLCRIYRNGYYTDWTDDDATIFAKRAGEGFTPALVNEVVQELAKRGFFDKTFLSSFNILTSKGIQKRYFEAVERRKDVEIDSRYLLVDTSKYPNVHIIKPNVDISPPDDSILQQKKGEEKKGDESKEEGKGAAAPVEPKVGNKFFTKPSFEDVTHYVSEKLNNNKNSELVARNFYDFYESNGWHVGRRKMVDWKATVRNSFDWERNKTLINGTHQQTPNGTGGKQAGAVSFLQRGQKIFGAG